MILSHREWVIGYNLTDSGNVFGATASDISGKDNRWNIKPTGTVICGSYAEAVKDIHQFSEKADSVQSIIVFFKKNERTQEFLNELSAQFTGIPICGGGASPLSDGEARIYPDGDVAMLFISDNRYSFKHFWCNLHVPTGELVYLRVADSRTILAVCGNDGETLPASEWLRRYKQAYGINEKSYEHITLTTEAGYNLHLSPKGEFALATGADLPLTGQMRVSVGGNEQIQGGVNEILAHENRLIFGCAGLRALIVNVEKSSSLCGFLHGEVLTAGLTPCFANLMISALEAVPKTI